jgi:hypothetical protein
MFINREQWGEIYDIARYNGYEVHRLVVELCAANPKITEPELLEAAREWSRNRTDWPKPLTRER